MKFRDMSDDSRTITPKLKVTSLFFFKRPSRRRKLLSLLPLFNIRLNRKWVLRKTQQFQKGLKELLSWSYPEVLTLPGHCGMSRMPTLLRSQTWNLPRFLGYIFPTLNSPSVCLFLFSPAEKVKTFIVWFLWGLPRGERLYQSHRLSPKLQCTSTTVLSSVVACQVLQFFKVFLRATGRLTDTWGHRRWEGRRRSGP